MCSRALFSSRTLLAAATASGRQVARRSMTSKAPAVWKTQAELARLCRTTVNDLPIPAGAWRANYNRQQARWNRYLAANVAFFLFTLAAMHQTGCLYWHSYPSRKDLSSINPNRIK